MFSTSGDILNLVLAISIAALTIFLVMTIYYVISSIRKVHNLINKVESGVSKTEELVSLVKEKVNSSSTYLTMFAELAKHAIKYAQDNNWKKKGAKKAETGKKTKK